MANTTSQQSGAPKQKKAKRPSQPLSAYNLYFRYQRARLLSAGGSNKQQLNQDEAPAHHAQQPSPSDLRTFLSQNPYLSPESRKKRSHRKTHGAFSFTELSKIVSQGWKSLDDASKRPFHEVAHELKIEQYRKMEEERRRMKVQQAQQLNLTKDTDAQQKCSQGKQGEESSPQTNEKLKRPEPKTSEEHRPSKKARRDSTPRPAVVTVEKRVVTPNKSFKQRRLPESVMSLAAPVLPEWPHDASAQKVPLNSRTQAVIEPIDIHRGRPLHAEEQVLFLEKVSTRRGGTQEVSLESKGAAVIEPIDLRRGRPLHAEEQTEALFLEKDFADAWLTTSNPATTASDEVQAQDAASTDTDNGGAYNGDNGQQEASTGKRAAARFGFYEPEDGGGPSPCSLPPLPDSLVFCDEINFSLRDLEEDESSMEWMVHLL